MTFTVSFYVNYSRIQTCQVTLFPHGVESLTCTWNTIGLYGLCTLNFTLVLDFCPGELAIDDNINNLYHKVIIAMRTDLNYDSIIDISDIIIASGALVVKLKLTRSGVSANPAFFASFATSYTSLFQTCS